MPDDQNIQTPPLSDAGALRAQIAEFEKRESAQKSSVEALQREADFLRIVIEKAGHAIYVLDRAGRFVLVDRVTAILAGYEVNDLIGNPLSLLFSQEAFPAVNEHLQKAADCNQSSVRFEAEIVRKDSSKIWVNIIFNPVYHNGAVLHIVGTMEDISEEKKAEKVVAQYSKEAVAAKRIAEQKAAELEEAAIKLSELNVKLEFAKMEADSASQTKSQFLANMSHEIRTPMNAVIGFADLLSNTNLDDLQKDYVTTIKDSGEVLLGIINDILDISKIEAGHVHLEKIDFNMEHLVESVTKIISSRLKGKDVDLFYKFIDPMPRDFKGDPTRIRQVLLNLLNNSIKFTEKGEVGIIVRCEDITEFKEGEDPKTKLVHITVHDTGIGIPKDKHKMIFEAFTQADASTTRKYGGTGLGLAIVKAFIEMMGGDIYIESEPGKGSDFNFHIRIAETVPIADQNIFPVMVTQLRGLKVIIVDDNENARMIVDDYCTKAEIQVMTKCSSAEKALEWLAQQKELPEIILTDIMMPGIDGYMFARKIREKKEYDAIKIIAVSSDAVPGSSQKAQDHGFNAYVSKPISRNDLIKVIQTTIGDKRTSTGPIITRHTSNELALKGIKILVAEDNPVNQKLIGILLKNFGCEADIVSNGQEAVDKIRAMSYSVVLMDVQMPVMGGMAATFIIRNEISKDLPIIALTAHAMKEDEEKCLGAGMSDFLTKPIDSKKLKEKLMKWAFKQ